MNRVQPSHVPAFRALAEAGGPGSNVDVEPFPPVRASQAVPALPGLRVNAQTAPSRSITQSGAQANHAATYTLT
ncbi:hypothetical protein EVJ58_g6442 [Rhodofomes roseus]|uniref:Uncharacterized protein n=1 Tax=Rhodofomes roseus TaxID=34475 RepID=A0A4Y9Y8N1_9APHY|nr:hypothetical protein EVJ58_g6442 [Rhodofomes roseus]